MRPIPLLLAVCLLGFVSDAPATTAPSSQPATQPTTMPAGETSWLSGMFGPHRPKPAPVGKMFFTDDDGKTWFVDDATKIPPYTDANGKEAVLVYVYKCGKTGKPFAGYMLKYTPEGQETHGASDEESQRPLDGRATECIPQTLVKKPGDANWVSRTDDPQAFSKATTPACPDGMDLYPVIPNLQP